MKHDFDTVINRKNTDCAKWDFGGYDHPMWVADMDFKAAPKIAEAVEKRAGHNVYGYAIPPERLFDAYINWWDRRYGIQMKREEMLFATGVMPAITSIIRSFSSIGDKVLIQSPVYHVFFYVIENNDREVIENELIYENNIYHIDFEDLEEKLALEDTKLMLLCNPHNPIGKIWDKESLEKIGRLCKKHGVILVSDEIHCDLTNPGLKYVPFASLEEDIVENSIITIAPSKTFNIAGLQSSMVYTVNEEFYSKIQNQLTWDFSSGANVFAIDSVIAAYNESEDWLEELREYLFENKQIVESFLKEEIPEIKFVESEATYLLWLDCSDLNISSESFSEFLKENVSLFLSPGAEFGKCGDNFMRMNVACPKELLYGGLEALKEGVRILKENRK